MNTQTVRPLREPRAPALPFTTEGQDQMAIVLEAAAEDRELALIVAPSGSGKTFVAERYVAYAKARAAGRVQILGSKA